MLCVGDVGLARKKRVVWWDYLDGCYQKGGIGLLSRGGLFESVSVSRSGLGIVAPDASRVAVN
jgi:hypothetical protein